MQRFRASRRQRASYMKESFKIDDTRNKDLHFVVGSETVSCHQSMLIPISKFLRGLLRDRISRAGVQDVTIVLTEVKVSAVRNLLEYIYTGRTRIRRIKEVNEIDSVRGLLQIKIDIDKQIFPSDKSKNNSKSKPEEKTKQPEKSKVEVKPKENNSKDKSSSNSDRKSSRSKSGTERRDISQEKTRSKSGANGKEVPHEKKRIKSGTENKEVIQENTRSKSGITEYSQENTRSKSGITECSQENTRTVSGAESSQDKTKVEKQSPSPYQDQKNTKVLAEDIKKENALNSSVSESSSASEMSKRENLESEQDSTVQPLKLKLKVETNPYEYKKEEDTTEFRGSSLFDRILQSIKGESVAEVNEVEGGTYETVREELKQAVVESESSDEESDSDSFSDSEESDSDCDPSIPQLPVDSEDGMLSLNTSLLMVELSKDEDRLNSAINDFMESPSLEPGSCAECGHQLSQDNFVLHHGTHLEDVKQAKLRLLYPPRKKEEEEVVVQESTVKQEVMETDTATVAPNPPLEKEGVEQETDRLQQELKRISKGLSSFMDKMQRGERQLECTECQDTLTMINLVSHFQEHIQDIHQQIETLARKKKENKRKLEPVRKETPRKRLKESRVAPSKARSLSSEEKPTEEKDRIGSDDERKKMYKRIYGRKKYQYKINRLSEDVKVTEEEIDAEIAKEKAKYSGQSLLGGEQGETVNMSPGEILRGFVQFGSKEYKKEFKKARDRLYKRKLRVLRMQGIMDNTAALDIPRSDIEVEMLSRYTANRNYTAESNKASETTQEASENRKDILEDDLDLSLDVEDVGELFKGAETIMGDTSLSTIVSEITDEKTMQNVLADIVVKTTLEEEYNS